MLVEQIRTLRAIVRQQQRVIHPGNQNLN